LTRRVPRGPVLAITPFNFPLNLVAHKVAPALAASAPVVVKPAPATPLTALLLGEILAETDLPTGSFSVIPVPNERMDPLVTDARLPVVSFTGSGPVGWGIRDRVPRKHVTLELGGNAAALVCPDWTDVDRAAQRIATFGNYQAGQSCISVQRVYVHRDLHRDFVDQLVKHVLALSTGDPQDPDTDVGPLINEAAARRVVSQIDEAIAAGATALTGHQRTGAVIAPTVLTDVPETCAVHSEEVFGPVLVVAAVDSVADGFARINRSRYGLQSGVFTHDLRIAFRASAELDVGGVVIGDVPSYRADQMPYGGVKESGIGREGVRAAIDDLTEPRVLIFTDAHP
jgi:acyl-CoA reductase-like NAD-dependent aldehyde dehydrogenase